MRTRWRPLSVFLALVVLASAAIYAWLRRPNEPPSPEGYVVREVHEFPVSIYVVARRYGPPIIPFTVHWDLEVELWSRGHRFASRVVATNRDVRHDLPQVSDLSYDMESGLVTLVCGPGDVPIRIVLELGAAEGSPEEIQRRHNRGPKRKE